MKFKEFYEEEGKRLTFTGRQVSSRFKSIFSDWWWAGHRMEAAPFTTLAMTTNGTSGIIKDKQHGKIYFYVKQYSKGEKLTVPSVELE